MPDEVTTPAPEPFDVEAWLQSASPEEKADVTAMLEAKAKKATRIKLLEERKPFDEALAVAVKAKEAFLESVPANAKVKTLTAELKVARTELEAALKAPEAEAIVIAEATARADVKAFMDAHPEFKNLRSGGGAGGHKAASPPEFCEIQPEAADPENDPWDRHDNLAKAWHHVNGGKADYGLSKKQAEGRMKRLGYRVRFIPK